MTGDFIGRGEERALQILKHLFPEHDVYQQFPISDLIKYEQWIKLGKEHNQHKHDIVLQKGSQYIVCEVNYKHGVIAESKWHNVYKPLLDDVEIINFTVEDGECETLFDLKDGTHENTWQDWIDVLQALKTAGIRECNNA